EMVHCEDTPPYHPPPHKTHTVGDLCTVPPGCSLGRRAPWRLSAGPMQVHFLTPYLEAALAAALGGRRTTVHTTVLAWDTAAKNLEVRARQVIIQQGDGTPLVTLPTVDVKLSAWALLRGTVALTAINIEEVSGVLSRTPEGIFQFGASSADTPSPEQLMPNATEHSTSDFTLTDRVVTMRQLRTHGGALGLTVAGSIDLHASSVDLKGTIIPLYKVNTVVGKIPIVGDRL